MNTNATQDSPDEYRFVVGDIRSRVTEQTNSINQYAGSSLAQRTEGPWLGRDVHTVDAYHTIAQSAKFEVYNRDMYATEREYIALWRGNRPVSLAEGISLRRVAQIVPESTLTFLEIEVFDGSSYEDRIKYLQDVGKEDGIILNEYSVKDFNGFVEHTLKHKKASLVLTDNGNIRAVWRDNNDSHIGIHFYGDGKVSHVIFKRLSDDSISREAEIGTLEEARQLAHDLELV